MSLGLREERRRRRRQSWWTAVKWLIALCVIGLAGLYAYHTGSKAASARIDTLRLEIDRLSETVNALRQQNRRQQAEIASERQLSQEWQDRYGRDVPAGEMKELFDLMRTRLETGVTADRMRFVIGAVENREDCAPEPVIKRFIVQTPLQTGANSAVTFGDGAMTVNAVGVSDRDAAGRPEAWFDATKPITVRITRPGGETREVSGVLPLYPSIVIDDAEFRFSLVPAARGFVQIAGEQCAYP